MNDTLDKIRNRIEEIVNEYKDIIREIGPLRQEVNTLLRQIQPLEQKKVELQELIKTIERSLSLSEGTIIQLDEEILEDVETETLPATGPLMGKGAMKAYKETIINHFRDRSFTEPELRERATKDGLLINGQKIAKSYSRSVIVQLRKQGFIKRVKRGLYRLSKEERVRLIRLHRVRSPLD